jgi:hypothetical protein
MPLKSSVQKLANLRHISYHLRTRYVNAYTSFRESAKAAEGATDPETLTQPDR